MKLPAGAGTVGTVKIGGQATAPSTCTTAADGGKIRLLIFSGANNHDWKTTTPVLKAFYEAGGRFSVDITGDVPGINPEEFKKYDVIVCNYTSYPKVEGHRWPAETEKAFLDYVAAGHIRCTWHGALFRIDDGACVAGPCTGQRLTPWPVTVTDGTIVTA